jgi:hypothetical protein
MAQFQEFVIAQLPDAHENAGYNRDENYAHSNACWVKQEKAQQTEAGAYRIKDQDGLSMGYPAAKELVMDVLAISFK